MLAFAGNAERFTQRVPQLQAQLDELGPACLGVEARASGLATFLRGGIEVVRQQHASRAEGPKVGELLGPVASPIQPILIASDVTPSAGASGTPPSWRQVWIRYAVGTASLLLAGLGFFWAWIDRDRLTWHDRASGTRLVRVPKR